MTKSQSDMCIIAHFANKFIILSPNLETDNMNTPRVVFYKVLHHFRNGFRPPETRQIFCIFSGFLRSLHVYVTAISVWPDCSAEYRCVCCYWSDWRNGLALRIIYLAACGHTVEYNVQNIIKKSLYYLQKYGMLVGKVWL
jgi:hypothetical protein